MNNYLYLYNNMFKIKIDTYKFIRFLIALILIHEYFTILITYI